MKRSPLRKVSKSKKTISKQVRAALLERSEFRCERRFYFKKGLDVQCRRYGKHAHHILAQSQMGTDDLDNLVWLCEVCHRWVHDHPLAAIEDGLSIPYGGFVFSGFEDYKRSKGLK